MKLTPYGGALRLEHAPGRVSGKRDSSRVGYVRPAPYSAVRAATCRKSWIALIAADSHGWHDGGSLECVALDGPDMESGPKAAALRIPPNSPCMKTETPRVGRADSFRVPMPQGVSPAVTAAHPRAGWMPASLAFRNPV
jgi:hypothetical protein